ncbi:probable mediator of RNA polymerase II transcription subunit 15c [Prosopis cineraria]|uniref:probable mediator of RNA polymerase II transcription subunit 15c n=1 Tax=Prosopis cineraria TaxID=364024 RepID=UPI00240FE588|nr:probable mediator of RNA polymerase II transcription subunit 15c [Prosopis cineraria]
MVKASGSKNPMVMGIVDLLILDRIENEDYSILYASSANAIIVNYPWPYNTSEALDLAEKLEENENASAKDEADYILKIKKRIMSIEASSQVLGPKHLATSSNISEAASSSGSNKRVADVDGQEVLYKRVQMLKSMHFSELHKFYREIVVDLLQNHSSPQNTTLKAACIPSHTRLKKILEETFAFLNVTKSQISPDFKSKLDDMETQIRATLLHMSLVPRLDDKCSIQQAVPSQSGVSKDDLSEMQLTLPSTSLQSSHLSKQIPNQNKMNQQVKSAKSEQDNPESLTQQVAKEYSISQKHETPLSAATSDQSSPAIQRLVKVVSSMSHKSLSESISEIRDVICFSDISSAPFERPENVIRSNSVLDLGADSQSGYSKFGDFLTRETKIRSCHDAMPIHTDSLFASTSESFNLLTDADESDLNSVRPQVKWPMNGGKHALLEEITEVKKLLLDSEVVINEADIIPSVAAGAAEQGDGLIVELYFTGVTVSLEPTPHLVLNLRSMIKPLRLLIPTSYPIFSPILLDEMPTESRGESDDDLLTKAKLKLQSSLQSLTHPLLIKDIAMSWERCVREAIFDYAQKLGGGTFSSKYGGWENVEGT